MYIYMYIYTNICIYMYIYIHIDDAKRNTGPDAEPPAHAKPMHHPRTVRS